MIISVDVDAGEMQANSLQCFGPGVLVVTWSLTPTSVFCTLSKEVHKELSTTSNADRLWNLYIYIPPIELFGD